ncbi:ABC transporter ATP-binding protein [Prescottella defluvii]|uniref:ABC transporter ATP-binding protein n=1 Tax=Prescottella defluvii TaxID=1323361 RepID=UPI0039EC8B3D
MSEIVIDQVSKSFGPTDVLRGVSLSVAHGSITAVVGSSGCGKTTLLRIIAGFERPDDGTVSIAGSVVAGREKMVPAHRRRVGYVAQDGALFPHLTVAGNIAYGLPGARFGGRKAAERRVAELLEMVSLDASYGPRRPHELSGGQQQRVALARALARDPEVMLLDEPFSALDAGLRVTTRKSVAATLGAAGVTTLLVTHDQEEALTFAGQVAVMRTGRFTQVGTPEQLYHSPVDDFTARFLGECVLLPAEVADGVASSALGRIPVRDSDIHGPARLMLRPEQIVATEVPEGSGSSGVGAGTVTRTEFLGAPSMLDITLDTGAEIRVRQASTRTPAVGARVTVEVFGAGQALAVDG